MERKGHIRYTIVEKYQSASAVMMSRTTERKDRINYANVDEYPRWCTRPRVFPTIKFKPKIE